MLLVKCRPNDFFGLLRMVESPVIFSSGCMIAEVFPGDFSACCGDRNKHGGGVFLLVPKELQSE